MAAGAADVVVEFLHDLASTFDVADVTHGNDDPVFDQAGDDSPFNALDLQTKLRHLRNNVFAIDLAHVNHGDAVVQLKPGQSPPEGLEILAGQGGSLNPRYQCLVGKRIEKRERVEIGEVAPALQKQSVRFDSVEQRRR